MGTLITDFIWLAGLWQVCCWLWKGLLYISDHLEARKINYDDWRGL
jgi:hypothetical protein